MALNKMPLLTTLMLSSTLVLAACGESDEVNEPVGNETQTEEAPGPSDASPGGGTDEDSIGGETFGFTELSVDANYPELDDAVEISYEEDRDNIEAEYQNRFTEQNLSGNDAMDEIEPAFQELDITQETAEDEVIQQIVGAFGLEEGYTALEVEIRFPDGTEKEYKAAGN